MNEPVTFDPRWSEIYAGGHRQRYPWDCVVSFVFRNAPHDRARSEVSILEVGCGTASNLWFAAREGFRVTGLDGSADAIATARERFVEDGLEGELTVGDFTDLPYGDDVFDLAIDRAAITCSGRAAGRRAIAEVCRVLRPGGRFFFNPYAAGHSSEATGRPGPDGVVVDIEGGTLTGVGQICFYGETDIAQAFGEGWELISQSHVALTERLGSIDQIHSEWRVIAEKTV